MSSRTYYDILGVSRDANSWKKLLQRKMHWLKVYHPDANMHKDIDTTAFMQEIRKALSRVLSLIRRKEKLIIWKFLETTDRVFKTFKLTPAR